MLKKRKTIIIIIITIKRRKTDRNVASPVQQDATTALPRDEEGKQERDTHSTRAPADPESRRGKRRNKKKQDLKPNDSNTQRDISFWSAHRRIDWTSGAGGYRRRLLPASELEWSVPLFAMQVASARSSNNTAGTRGAAVAECNERLGGGKKKTGKIGELSEDRAVRFPEWGPPALVAKGKSYLARRFSPPLRCPEGTENEKSNKQTQGGAVKILKIWGGPPPMRRLSWRVAEPLVKWGKA